MSETVFANQRSAVKKKFIARKHFLDRFAMSISNENPDSGNSKFGDKGAKSQRTTGRIPPKFYRIGEVVEYSGLSRQTIHNYTTMGLLSECKWTRGGHRLYDETVFARLDKIAELKSSNKTMREIRRYFSQSEPNKD